MTSQSQATPLTPAALLLRGLGAPGGRACLPCDPSVRAALEELRAALVPAHFPLERLQARARALLQGREGRFFRDYALSAFVGRAEVDGLQGVASFLKNRTQDSLMSSLTDGPLLEKLVNVREQVIKEFKKVLRSCELKELLKEEVLDCLHCQKTSPKGVKAKCCFALEFEMIGKRPRTQRLVGIFMVVFPALFFFLVILISTYMDWLRTQKPLMSMAEPNQANDWQEV